MWSIYIVTVTSGAYSQSVIGSALVMFPLQLMTVTLLCCLKSFCTIIFWYWIDTLHGTRSWCWLVGIAGAVSMFDVGGRLSAAWCRS